MVYSLTVMQERTLMKEPLVELPRGVQTSWAVGHPQLPACYRGIVGLAAAG